MNKLESYEFTKARVKLFKRGFSHDEITSIFETLSSPSDLHNLPLIVKKCEELVLMPENRKYLGLIDEFCKFLIANDNEEPCQITAIKKKGKWHFEVS